MNSDRSFRTQAPPEVPSAESVPRYDEFDFAGLWRGREAVTAVETRLVREALGESRPLRVLEAGTGFGRLSPTVAGLANEYVGADLDATQFAAVRSRAALGRPGGPNLLVEANLYHLPFRAATFDLIVCVRVYHHIRSPSVFLAELGRVLAPGGRLLLSFAPQPTVGTLRHDVAAFLANRTERVTWSGKASEEYNAAPFPTVVPTVPGVFADLAAAGFEVLGEWGVGPERFAALLPPAEGPHGRWSGFFLPTRFVVARRGPDTGAALPPLESAIACPRCGTPAPKPGLASPGSTDCGSCGFRFTVDDGVLRAVYLPPGTLEHRAAGAGADRGASPRSVGVPETRP